MPLAALSKIKNVVHSINAASDATLFPADKMIRNVPRLINVSTSNLEKSHNMLGHIDITRCPCEDIGFYLFLRKKDLFCLKLTRDKKN